MYTSDFSFELITQDDKARLGKINTPRGEIDTPAFMPVGTLGTVKGVYTDDLLKINTHIILGWLQKLHFSTSCSKKADTLKMSTTMISA